jgi:3-hydroxyisobutyrate dehydrogenase-like beta-hydroxyacid dehydrogenase
MAGSPRTVGVVGLGAIGGRITRRLLAAGHQVVAFDVSADALTAACAGGAEPAPSATAVADKAETCLLSLPTPEIVETALNGPGGLLGGAVVTTCVDLSTTGRATSERVAAAAAEAGIGFLDAPISGGAAGAERGTLTVMAAGDVATLEAARTVLTTFATTILHVGERPGLGQLAKVLNNMLSATALAATAEVMALGVRAGLDPRLLLEVFNASSGRNTATADKFPRAVLPRSFDVGFALALMNKDVQMCLAEAREAGFAEPPIAAAVARRWAHAAAASAPGADCTEIVRLIEAETGTTIADRDAAEP